MQECYFPCVKAQGNVVHRQRNSLIERSETGCVDGGVAPLGDRGCRKADEPALEHSLYLNDHPNSRIPSGITH